MTGARLIRSDTCRGRWGAFLLSRILKLSLIGLRFLRRIFIHNSLKDAMLANALSMP